MSSILLCPDGSPYEDLISLEAIPIQNAYLLQGRYYDINSLYSYVMSRQYHVIPHTRQELTISQEKDIIRAYTNKCNNQHQRHHVREVRKDSSVFGIECILLDYTIDKNAIIYEKNGDGRVNKYYSVVPYFQGGRTYFVHTTEKVIRARDIVGYSLPCDQIGVV